MLAFASRLAFIFSLLLCTPVNAQFKRPTPATATQRVSPQLQLAIMTQPEDKQSNGMLAFSPDGTQLYVGCSVLGLIPSRPVPPEQEFGSGGSTASAAVNAAASEVDDGVWIGAPQQIPRQRIGADASVVMGGTAAAGSDATPQYRNHAISVYQVSDGKQLRVYQPQQTNRPDAPEPCTWGLLSYDGKHLACFGKVDVFLTMYDTVSGQPLFRVLRKDLIFKNPWGASAFAQDSASLLTVTKGVVSVFETTTGKLLDQENLGPHPYTSSLLTSRVAPRFFYGSSVWNSQTAQRIAPSFNPNDSEAQLIRAVSADGEVMLGASKSHVFAIHQGQRTTLLDGYELRDGGETAEQRVTGTALSDDGRLFAAAIGKQIFVGKLLNKNGQPQPQRLATLEGHLQRVDGLAFSRDARLLASSSPDGSTRIWDLANLESASSHVLERDLKTVVPRSEWHDWGAEQMIGPPDSHSEGTNRTAWCPSTSHNPSDWLLLEYDKAAIPSTIVIHEVNIPGGVHAVTLIDDQGKEQKVWTNDEPPPRDGSFERSKTLRIPVEAHRPYRIVRIDCHPGWNEIDAVGLETADGKTHWAIRADASSTCGNEAIHDSLVANYPQAELLPFRKSAAVEVESKGTWYAARVLKVGGPDRYTIRFDGWDASYDETVPASRIRQATDAGK